MNDLELRLRDDLRNAADTMPADLDLDVLLHRGRRRRAARTNGAAWPWSPRPR